MLGERKTKTLSKQDQMLDKQDQMLGKQDSTIEILKSVKCDTSVIKGSLSDSMGRYHHETLDL